MSREASGNYGGRQGNATAPILCAFPEAIDAARRHAGSKLLLRRMKKAGVTDVILAVNHLSHLIKAFFGNGSELGLRISYSKEDRPLGTAGALGNMLDDLDETFLVANGDLLTTMDLAAMARQHSETRCDASIGIFERENKIDFGLIEFDFENRLCAYREKPTNMYYVSMGVYILQREAVRQNIALGDYQDMPSLLLNMRAAKADVRCYHDDCMWLDIGRPDDFALAQSMFESNRALFLEE